MVDQKTPYLGLSLPHLDNTIDQDCPRMRRTLAALDSHAQTTDAALEAHTAALAAETAARAQADAQQAETLAAETTAREQADADQVETLASLAATVANLWQEMAALNPWTIFPVRVPIAVDGVRFGGSDGRRAILPGETQARENWVLCDGGDDGKGGTVPDLRDRMILGASESRPSGSTGGSETHQHSVTGTVGETTLTVAQSAAHWHTVTLRDTGWGNQALVDAKSANRADSYKGELGTSSVGSSAPHTHSLTGSSGESANLSPYYTLTYIMRCA